MRLKHGRLHLFLIFFEDDLKLVFEGSWLGSNCATIFDVVLNALNIRNVADEDLNQWLALQWGKSFTAREDLEAVFVESAPPINEGIAHHARLVFAEGLLEDDLMLA